MVAAPERPPCSLEEAVAVLYVRVRVEGFYDEGAVWCPAAIACGAMIEQLGLFVACYQQGSCRCYLNGNPLHNDPVAVTHGDFLAIFKSDHAHRVLPGHAALSLAAGDRQGGYHVGFFVAQFFLGGAAALVLRHCPFNRACMF